MEELISTPLISKFEVEAFRCFATKQALILAEPAQGKLGSGITYVVGENNCGKTSLLEGMKYSLYNINRTALRSSDVRSLAISFTYFDKDTNVLSRLILMRPGSTKLKEDETATWSQTRLTLDNEPIFIPSRRQWSPMVNNDLSLDSVRAQLHNQNVALRQHYEGYADSQMAEYFNAIESNEENYQRFIELMRRVFPDFQSFTIEVEDSAYITYEMRDGSRHRADFLGDGVVSVMRIIALFIVYPKRLVVIDEPELSLHPNAIKRLNQVIAERAQEQQIVLATHSPLLISWEYIKNGAKLNHIVHKNGCSKIHTLQDISAYKSLVNSGNWKQPYVMDVVSKEIFFSDNILFTEGQEDVGLLNREEKLNKNIHLFGYGARGYNNFPFSLALARDLGLEKAGVIIDGGEKESKVAEELRKEYPDYLIVQWEKLIYGINRGIAR
ncbi:AAA family ATPase [Candidatus Saccharibacteria bacterium]|nr:AAA family ATPase [Candidatus Saccharibacteria bacterium]